MKIYRATVDSVLDLTKTGRFTAVIPVLSEGPVEVTYVSPTSNLDAGFFAPPTPTSEILVLWLDADGPGKQAGYYYLGSCAGYKRFVTNMIPPELLGDDCLTNPESAEEVQKKWAKKDGFVKLTSLGFPADTGPSLPREFWDAYSNEISPEKMGMVDKVGQGVVFSDQKVGGEGEGWINAKARLQSGAGKSIDLIDTPAIDCIKITTGKTQEGGEDSVKLGGKQDSKGAEGSTLQAGEFSVDTHGPTNIVSRERGIELRARGLNLDLINDAEGLWSSQPTGRKMVGVGGGQPVLTTEEEDIQGYSTAEGDQLRENSPPFNPVSSYAAGQAHPDINSPGSGGNPLDKGVEDFGCVNIKSKWNNINLEGLAPDSVIHINAPGLLTKVVVTTGGTVDIMAKQKISITSDEKIELNAPYVDINGLTRVDLD